MDKAVKVGLWAWLKSDLSVQKTQAFYHSRPPVAFGLLPEQDWL